MVSLSSSWAHRWFFIFCVFLDADIGTNKPGERSKPNAANVRHNHINNYYDNKHIVIVNSNGRWCAYKYV